MPLRSAAAISSSPFSATMALPSIVIGTPSLTSGAPSVVAVSDTGSRPRRRGDGHAGLDGPVHVGLELGAEALDGRRDRRHRRRAERADRRLLRRPRDAWADVVA